MLIPVVVGGQTVWCRIDTGATDAVILPQAIFDKVTKSGGSHNGIAGTAEGLSDFRMAILPQVKLLGKELDGVSVSSTGSDSGWVGMGALSRFVLTVDYPGKRVYARPLQSFNHRDSPKRSGIGWVRRDGQVVVEFLEPGGAAERAGARLGDVMVSINGRPSDALEFLDEISDVFSKTTLAYRVVALRGKRSVEYAFSPE